MVEAAVTADNTCDTKPLRVGLDIGSTTVKAVVLDQTDSLDAVLFSDYRRHHANVRATVAGLLEDIHKELEARGRGNEPIRLAITGSGGLALADNLHVPFVQEVIAETRAIDEEYPQADVIIELGGEDAKITYLKPTPEQRMNGSCAGGTGAFIDQMATLLDTDAAGLNDMAKHYETLYPIASRCGVFAKTDLQPLINDGAAKPDLAASIFTAVATQTIAGLASGRPIHGTVIFLGGPLFFMSELREAFHRALEDKVDEFIVPTDAHLYVAFGSALLAGEPDQLEEGQHFEARTCADILKSLEDLKNLPANTPTMPPLFPTEADREAFNKRHHREHVHIGTLEGAQGPHFLGIDAGSTTIKATLVNDDRENKTGKVVTIRAKKGVMLAAGGFSGNRYLRELHDPRVKGLGTDNLPGSTGEVAMAAVRVGVSRAIVQSIVGTESELPVITLEPRLEQILLNSLQKAGQGSEEGVLLEPSMAEKLQRSLIDAAQRQEMQGQPVILLVAGPVRAMLSRFGRLAVPNLHVLAYQEIPDNKQVTIVATVGPNG